MAENITIIRLEISEVAASQDSSENTRVPNSTSAATGFLAGSISKSSTDSSKFNIAKDVIFTSSTGGRVGNDFRIVKNPFSRPFDKYNEHKGSFRLAMEQYRNAKQLRTSAINEDRGWQSADFYEAADALEVVAKKNLENFRKSITKSSKKAVLYGGMAYAAYSKYKSEEYNLSGADHAAGQQQRKSNIAAFGAGLGYIALSGNVLGATMMLAARAFQLSLANRSELYQIRSSQIVSSIMKERLVTNTIQRRF